MMMLKMHTPLFQFVCIREIGFAKMPQKGEMPLNTIDWLLSPESRRLAFEPLMQALVERLLADGLLLWPY